MRRFTIAIGLGLLALVGAGAWLARSEHALAFIAQRAEQLSGGRVAIEGASGSLFGPLRAKRVRVCTGETRTVAEGVALAPRWSALAGGVLAFDAVTIGALHIEPGPPNDEPRTLPRSIALPFALELSQIEIGRIAIREREWASGIRASARLGREAHEAAVSELSTPWGALSGRARVATTAPFATSGEIAYTRAAQPRATATVRAEGTLVALALHLAGETMNGNVSGEVALAFFEKRWLETLTLSGQHLDVAEFFAGENAPHTDVSVAIATQGADSALLVGTLRAENAAAAPLSRGAVPVRALASALRLEGALLRFPELSAELGPAGAASGEARIEAGELRLALDVKQLDLHALHESLRATQLAGEVSARLGPQRVEGTLALRERARELRGRFVREGKALRAEDVRIAIGRGEIAGNGDWDGANAFSARAHFSRFDPAALGDFPSASLSGELDAEGAFGAAWRARIHYSLFASRYRGRALSGSGALTLAADHVSEANAQLRLGANRLVARGGFGAPGAALDLTLDAPELSALGGEFDGSLSLEARLVGTRALPGGEFTATASELSLPGGLGVRSLTARGSLAASSERALSVSLRGDQFTASGAALEHAEVDASGSLAEHRVTLRAGGKDVALSAELSGAWHEAWSGRVEALENAGRFAIRLLEPAPLSVALPLHVDFGPARFGTLGGELALGSLALANGRVASAGVASDLLVGELLAALGRDPAAAGDLRVRGVWVIPADPAQLGQVRLEHASGDALLAGSPLGIRALEIDAALDASVAHVSASVSGERLGEAYLRADLHAAPGRALLARSAEVDARLDANLTSLRAFGGLLGISARVEGNAALALSAGGSVGAPQISGTVGGEGLRFDWPSAGVALRNGALRARVTPTTLHVDALTFAAAKGEIRAHGAIPLDGTPAELDWEADHLRVLDRPDRNLEVTGTGTASLTTGRLALRGALRANRGYLELPRTQQARLGDDVIVLGRERTTPGAAASTRLDLDLELDAGNNLRIVGAGLDTFLRGKLRVKTLPDGTLVAFGKIDADRGTYRAFGQKLEIERGSLIFNGPLVDPALDVLALRKNLAVEAGVELTGTLKTPLANLTSRPPVPDSEKLSWLVLGHAASDASAADTGLLQAAAATLLSGDGAVPIGQRVAHGVGLDEIALRETGNRASAEASDRAVALGKRLTDNLYIEYEYGLEAASHLVRLHYTLTRALSVRAETTGETSDLGVNYRKSWD